MFWKKFSFLLLFIPSVVFSQVTIDTISTQPSGHPAAMTAKQGAIVINNNFRKLRDSLNAKFQLREGNAVIGGSQQTKAFISIDTDGPDSAMFGLDGLGNAYIYDGVAGKWTLKRIADSIAASAKLHQNNVFTGVNTFDQIVASVIVAPNQIFLIGGANDTLKTERLFIGGAISSIGRLTFGSQNDTIGIEKHWSPALSSFRGSLTIKAADVHSSSTNKYGGNVNIIAGNTHGGATFGTAINFFVPQTATSTPSTFDNEPVNSGSISRFGWIFEIGTLIKNKLSVGGALNYTDADSQLTVQEGLHVKRGALIDSSLTLKSSLLLGTTGKISWGNDAFLRRTADKTLTLDSTLIVDSLLASGAYITQLYGSTFDFGAGGNVDGTLTIEQKPVLTQYQGQATCGAGDSVDVTLSGITASGSFPVVS